MVKFVQFAAAGSYGQNEISLGREGGSQSWREISRKTILTTYSFKYPFMMTLSHMLVGLLLLHGLKFAKVIRYAPFDVALAKKALPVAICFIANCVLGMVALKGTNIPMFATLRRLTVFMVVLCEVLVLRKKQTALIVLSVTIMVFGSFIGGWGDLQFDLFGYSMVLLNNLVTALNLVFIKKTLNDTKLATDTFGVLYYNSILSIPFLGICSILTGEVSSLVEYPHMFDRGFQFAFLLSALMSFLMNYSTFWCTEVNSALTTSVTGQVKNVLSSFVSLAMFGGVSNSGVGVEATPLLLTGLTVGLFGSFLYAYAIYKQDLSRQKKAVEKSSGSATTIPPTSSSNPAANTSSVSQQQQQQQAVDGDLTAMTGGVVNQLHSTKANERHANSGFFGKSFNVASTTTLNSAKTPRHGMVGGILLDGGSSDHTHDAKLHRLESGQRSPMVAPALSAAGANATNGGPSGLACNSTNGIIVPVLLTPNGRTSFSITNSPNSNHPHNNPYKSKPN